MHYLQATITFDELCSTTHQYDGLGAHSCTTGKPIFFTNDKAADPLCLLAPISGCQVGKSTGRCTSYGMYFHATFSSVIWIQLTNTARLIARPCLTTGLQAYDNWTLTYEPPHERESRRLLRLFMTSLSKRKVDEFELKDDSSIYSTATMKSAIDYVFDGDPARFGPVHTFLCSRFHLNDF